jgi:hypothetical protein
MYVWTAKAEREFKAKYPRRVCQRKAGTEATYDGKKLTRQFVIAYAERGWIDAIDDVIPDAETRGHRLKNAEKAKVHEKRWKDLQFWLRQKNVPSVNYVAVCMGLSGSEILSKFVRDHGVEMAGKYGKLPFFPGGRGQHLSDYWERVMEAKA